MSDKLDEERVMGMVLGFNKNNQTIDSEPDSKTSRQLFSSSRQLQRSSQQLPVVRIKIRRRTNHGHQD
ncbi:MAG: hypothetical protein PWQ27_235 [Kosmotoga sp.]|nr:hypothetical protein [Kosmotoga sp.]